MDAHPAIDSLLPMNLGNGAVILVMAQAENTARRIESYLRNSGHPVRVAWIPDLEDLEDSLRRGAPNLLLVEQALIKSEFASVAKLGQRWAPDLPILLLAEQISLEMTAAAIALGAQDVVCASDDDLMLQHLQLLCMREFTHHHHLHELRQLRRRMQSFEVRHQQLLADTQDAIVHLHDGIVTHCNPAFAEKLGLNDPSSLLGQTLMDLVVPEHQSRVKAHFKRLNKHRGALDDDDRHLDCQLRRSDDQPGPEVHAELDESEEDGEPIITLLIRAAVAPVVDEPTAPADVFRSLRERLAAPRTKDTPLAILAIMVDDFRGMESRLGHLDAGEAADRVHDWLTESAITGADRLFRTGVHEWVALISRNDTRDIVRHAEDIAERVQRQVFTTSGHEAHLSLTVAGYPLAVSESATAAMGRIVDEARERSAKGGRQAVVLGPTALASRQVQAIREQAETVRAALADNRMKLAYQSIASLEGDARQHFDVLLRMITPEGEEQHASAFIGAAQQFGLMAAIDRWVIERALHMQSKRKGADVHSSLFVKISEQSVKEADSFIAWFTALVEQRPLQPHELIFEFQEVNVQSHIRKARQLAEAMQPLGVEIAIEHFGIGAHSAQLVEHLPVRYLKFHPVFTQEFDNRDRQSRMSELMDVAKKKKIKTIVSHVENAQAMAKLWQLGVNFIQGYSVQEPEVVLLAADLRP